MPLSPLVSNLVSLALTAWKNAISSACVTVALSGLASA